MFDEVSGNPTGKRCVLITESRSYDFRFLRCFSILIKLFLLRCVGLVLKEGFSFLILRLIVIVFATRIGIVVESLLDLLHYAFPLCFGFSG